MKGNVPIQDEQSLNGVCKFLGRLKSNFNLQDLISGPFNEWIEAVSDLTIKLLTQWICASGSIVHLLSLWARLTTSLTYVKVEDATKLIESKIPEIINAYINSRMQCVIGAQNGLIEETLEDEGRILEQMDPIQHLCRFQYDKTQSILNHYLDPLFIEAEKLANHPAGFFPVVSRSQILIDRLQYALMEGKLAWMIYIAAGIVKGQPSAFSGSHVRPIQFYILRKEHF